MEPDHARWVTMPATADRWTISVGPDPEANPLEQLWEVTLTVHCDRRPRQLFSHIERRVSCGSADYALHDLVSHFQLVMQQERPTRRDIFSLALMGQAQLPY